MIVSGTVLGHTSSNPTFGSLTDYISGSSLHTLETNCASRDSASQSAGVSKENEHRPAKRIALPKEKVALKGIIRADLRPKEARDYCGKRIALPKAQVALQGIITADLRPNEVCTLIGKLDIKKNPQNGPAMEVKWMGNFKIHDCPSDVEQCEGIIAHPSANVARKAHSFAKQMAGDLHFSMYAQGQICEDIFGAFFPSRDDIALYFYPGNYKRSKHQYSALLKFIERNGLMLRSRMGDVELLVFPSKLLEVDSQKLDGSFFMWGVFHRVKGETSANNGGTPASRNQVPRLQIHSENSLAKGKKTIN